MDHQEAVRQKATERYLLDELDPELRDQFEEHLFDCQDCALDVRAAQRTVLPITPAGSQPVVLELTPGVYTPATPEMTVSWGPSTVAMP